MNYWLDLFTGTTWHEFRDAGATVTGFNERVRRYAKTIEPGDMLLCYVTGVKRWVGALEVVGLSDDERRIWREAEFPVRFEVRPVIVLDPEYGVPMANLEGKVSFYAGPEDKGKFKGIVRRSPNLLKEARDGARILELLQAAKREPVERPVDPKKLARPILFAAERRKGRKSVETKVSVPEPDDTIDETAVTDGTSSDATSATRHAEIQYHLLKLGSEMGFEIWVAKNDRSRSWNGEILGEMHGMIDTLPTQFNKATNRTIELIDVLWLKGNSIIAAFEVESTTSVYSGLLRMSDLLALQPNLDIKLYLVAPDERRGKVENEILRPTFKLRDKPLSEICGFLSFSMLVEKVEGIRNLGLESSLKPDFLERTAEHFSDTDADD